MGLLKNFREKVYEPIDMVVGTATAVAVTAGYFGYAEMQEQNETLIADNAELQQKVGEMEETFIAEIGELKEVIGAFTDAAKERAGEAVDAARERGAEAIDGARERVEEFDAEDAEERVRDGAGSLIEGAKGLFGRDDEQPEAGPALD